ncbi:hypothetical protein OJ252_1297 [Cryptosporidium canis]|uniref:Uncharacterized protein n=1 Tax=Cryptosporidium canis TaxID=195482 RepID=A0ABQ8P8W5_9CRYT|nr:hypothetical protein OJ252_1297 [Cryptosporidium canis]
MLTEHQDCESYQSEIIRLKNKIYNISKSNINSQKLLEEKYTIQIEQLKQENYQLKKAIQEYEEYKLKSESYYEEVNQTLVVAKAKLQELHEKNQFLEKCNSELESKYKDTKSLLSIMVENNNCSSNYSKDIPINENKPCFLGKFDTNSITI